MSWEQIDVFVKRIAKNIKENNITIDTIVPIVRGGMVPGRLLSELLGVKDIFCITASLYDESDKRRSSVDLKYFDQYANFWRKTILLVDDIADSGLTLTEVRDMFDEDFLHRPNKIMSATVYYKSCSKFMPDFIGETADVNSWIVFPWESHE